MTASFFRLMVILSMLGRRFKWNSATAAHTPQEIPSVRMAAFSTCAIAGSAAASTKAENNTTCL